jgi:hypothetical protein
MKNKHTSCTQLLRDILNPRLTPTFKYSRKPHNFLSFRTETRNRLTVNDGFARSWVDDTRENRWAVAYGADHTALSPNLNSNLLQAFCVGIVE